MAKKAAKTPKKKVKKPAAKRASAPKKPKKAAEAPAKRKPPARVKKQEKPAETQVEPKETKIRVIEVKPRPVEKKEQAKPLESSPAQATPAMVEERVPEAARPKAIILEPPVLVKDLAGKLTVKPAVLISALIKRGVFANINQSIPLETASRVVEEMGFVVERPPEEKKQERERKAPAAKDDARLKTRPPIVTFMGHVDHGKTSLLDAIRKTNVVDKEAGGMTQHIGAYEVFLDRGAVTFLDTPGHEAFTAMRARGARCTDVVVLVVAADDGFKPQTEEALDHAQAADATIVVAINKIDLPHANVDRVKKQLAERGLQPEDWGGKTITVNVSAKTGEGINRLLEMLLLESEMLELKADPEADPKGTVVEAKLSRGSGPVATMLIQEGTLRVGDVIVCGGFYGRVRAMVNDRGQRVHEAPPAMPVEISGLSGVPRAGEAFYRVKNEITARDLLEEKAREHMEKGTGAHITLEQVYTEIHAGHIKALKIIIKSDVQGSVEALRKTLTEIRAEEVRLQIIHTGIGNITKSDIMLAAASNAIVIGFHVSIVTEAADLIRQEGVDVRLYQIIYEVKTAIEKAMSGLLPPKITEEFVGSAEIRKIFKVSKIGIIAGSFVLKGKIIRNASCRVVRNGQMVYEGKVTGLKRFKDDVREVAEGFECGISVANFKDWSEGDKLEVYEIKSDK